MYYIVSVVEDNVEGGGAGHDTRNTLLMGNYLFHVIERKIDMKRRESLNTLGPLFSEEVGKQAEESKIVYAD